jgi:hypothetical protein
MRTLPTLRVVDFDAFPIPSASAATFVIQLPNGAELEIGVSYHLDTISTPALRLDAVVRDSLGAQSYPTLINQELYDPHRFPRRRTDSRPPA